MISSYNTTICFLSVFVQWLFLLPYNDAEKYWVFLNIFVPIIIFTTTTTTTTLTTSDSTATSTGNKVGHKIVRQRIQVHRIISWALVLFSLITIILGYAIARNWTPDSTHVTSFHLIFEWGFILLLLFHVLYTLRYIKISSFRLLKNPRLHWLRITQQITKWLILIFAVLVILSGISYYEIILVDLIPFSQHQRYDIFLIISIIFHVMASAKLALKRRRVKSKGSDIAIVLIGLIFLILAVLLQLSRLGQGPT